MSDQPSPAEQRLPVLPLSGFTTATLGDSLTVVRLDVFSGPEKIGGATKAFLVGMTPEQAAALGKSLLKIVEAIGISHGAGTMQEDATPGP